MAVPVVERSRDDAHGLEMALADWNHSTGRREESGSHGDSTGRHKESKKLTALVDYIEGPEDQHYALGSQVGKLLSKDVKSENHEARIAAQVVKEKADLEGQEPKPKAR